METCRDCAWCTEVITAVTQRTSKATSSLCDDWPKSPDFFRTISARHSNTCLQGDCIASEIFGWFHT
ncbi:hypothetical protein DPMN_112735 [Dreissena polymorpha]|uniref:Uncharacterized protein n=1 Tax=Dreissena polymorpha TaxID=45954 RepID=A0A9D4QQ56_DREPO|nr:hypothetical protein DPMN_112735 [Dreissena polymorpha]